MVDSNTKSEIIKLEKECHDYARGKGIAAADKSNLSELFSKTAVSANVYTAAIMGKCLDAGGVDSYEHGL